MFPIETTLRRAARAVPGLVVASMLALAACRSNVMPPTEWPPDDFRLRVHVTEVSAAGGSLERSFLVWADGLAIYREAREMLDATRLPVPIYRTVAVYRLDPRSTRTLCRELDWAGLLRSGEPEDVNRAPLGGSASIAWWAHGDAGYASRRQLDRGPLDRGLEIVDAYLPLSRRFVDGDPVYRRAEEVPEPWTDTLGALDAHVRILRGRPVDADFLREVFALAVAAGKFEIARDALDEIVDLGPDGAGGEPVPREVWDQFEIQPMRDFLRDSSGG